MRVLVPLNSTEHLDEYINAGAEEFYIGFYDREWEEEFGEYSDINRMSGYKQEANPNSFNDIISIISEIKKKEKFVYVTFNSSIYGKNQLEYIEKYFEKLKESLVDGVIVSCIELVILAKKVGLFVVISTIGGVYNKDISNFYRDYGADRIILPRDLAIYEIANIVSENTDMEYEIFMMRNGCVFSDSNCLGFHRKEMCSICADISQSECRILTKDEGFVSIHNIELNDNIYRNYFHNYACGLCSIYSFLQMKITACKIVGRTDDYQSICNDINLVYSNIKIAEKCINEEEYLCKMIFPEEREVMCKLGLSCYYPESRFGH